MDSKKPSMFKHSARTTFSRLRTNRIEPGPDAVVHVLYHAWTPCQKPMPPSAWEDNHFWVGVLEDKTRVNCPTCKAWLEKDPQ